MKIYKYHKGEMHEMGVRETAKMYIKDKSIGTTLHCKEAFGYNVRFDKSIACTTPEQAILEAKNSLLTKIGIFEDALSKALADLLILENSEGGGSDPIRFMIPKLYAE